MIQVTVEYLPGQDKVKEQVVKTLVETVLKGSEISQAHIAVIFTDDDYLRKLKQEFFQLDQWTDVIAFRLNDYDEEEVEGEIYISLPRARENSVTFAEPMEKEVARLIVHGSLHLLGLDDGTPEEKAVMTEKEDAVLQEVNWKPLMKSTP